VVNAKRLIAKEYAFRRLKRARRYNYRFQTGELPETYLLVAADMADRKHMSSEQHKYKLLFRRGSPGGRASEREQAYIVHRNV